MKQKADKAFYAFQTQWNQSTLYLKETHFSVTVGDVMWVIFFSSRYRRHKAGRARGREASSSERQAEREEGAAPHRSRSARCRGSTQRHHHLEQQVFGFRSDHKQQFDRVSALQSRNNRFRFHRFLFVEVAPEPPKFTELHLDYYQAACPPVQQELLHAQAADAVTMATSSLCRGVSVQVSAE